ncbi:hypothetical protein BH10PSE14_BH10PSE14_37460 [soil metagenome]
MKRRRNFRPQRMPIFIGCEGQSEMGYAGWLRFLVRDRDLPVHLELSDLGLGAGDPLARIDLAIERLARLEANREPYVGRFVLLDTDQLEAIPDRAERARRRAIANNITVIWQVPTHEAFLLRHFAGRLMDQPHDARAADAALAREWAGYRKPSPAHQLERRLDLAGAHRVAGLLPELAELLQMIGLLEFVA